MNSQETADFLSLRLQAEQVSIPRERRVMAEISTAKMVEAVQTLKEAGMINIGAITGLDLGDRFEIIYHLYNNDGVLLNLKVFISRENPRIPSVAGVFPGVFLYERELIDLFGIMVEGNSYNRKYPLPEDWPDGEYPLRKDWKGLPAEKEVTENGAN